MAPFISKPITRVTAPMSARVNAFINSSTSKYARYTTAEAPHNALSRNEFVVVYLGNK